MKNISRFAVVAGVAAFALTLGACNKANRSDTAASTTEVKACEKGAACCKNTGKACADSACAGKNECKDKTTCEKKN